MCRAISSFRYTAPLIWYGMTWQVPFPWNPFERFRTCSTGPMCRLIYWRDLAVISPHESAFWVSKFKHFNIDILEWYVATHTTNTKGSSTATLDHVSSLLDDKDCIVVPHQVNSNDVGWSVRASTTSGTTWSLLGSFWWWHRRAMFTRNWGKTRKESFFYKFKIDLNEELQVSNDSSDIYDAWILSLQTAWLGRNRGCWNLMEPGTDDASLSYTTRFLPAESKAGWSRNANVDVIVRNMKHPDVHHMDRCWWDDDRSTES